MDLEQLQKRIAEIEQQVTAKLPQLKEVDALRRLENEVLGKEGSLGGLIAGIKDYPPEQRGQVGKTVNAAKGRVKQALDARRDELQAAAAAADSAGAGAFDPTLPGYVEPMAACTR